MLTGWSRKSSQWKWTVFCTWKNGGIWKDKGHMGGGVAPGLSVSTATGTVSPVWVRTDLVPPEVSIPPQLSPSGSDPDSAILSLSFHQLREQWAATPWRRCLILTADLSWQSLFPTDTNSTSQSLPALAGPPAPRIHTQPCPSWKCLKKRWGMSIHPRMMCVRCVGGGGGRRGGERCSFLNYAKHVLYNACKGHCPGRFCPSSIHGHTHDWSYLA